MTEIAMRYAELIELAESLYSPSAAIRSPGQRSPLGAFEMPLGSPMSTVALEEAAMAYTELMDALLGMTDIEIRNISALAELLKRADENASKDIDGSI